MRLTGSFFKMAAAMQTLEAATVAQPRREQSAALMAYSMFWARSSAEKEMVVNTKATESFS